MVRLTLFIGRSYRRTFLSMLVGLHHATTRIASHSKHHDLLQSPEDSLYIHIAFCHSWLRHVRDPCKILSYAAIRYHRDQGVDILGHKNTNPHL
jgi:hypothetical protein